MGRDKNMLRNDECYVRLVELTKRCRRFAATRQGRQNYKTKEWLGSPDVFLLEDLNALWTLHAIWEELRGVELIQCKEAKRSAPAGFRSWVTAVHYGSMQLIHGGLNAICRVVPMNRFMHTTWFPKALHPSVVEFMPFARDALIELRDQIRNGDAVKIESALVNVDEARGEWHVKFASNWPTAPEYPELREELGIVVGHNLLTTRFDEEPPYLNYVISAKRLVRVADQRAAIQRFAHYSKTKGFAAIKLNSTPKRSLYDLLGELESMLASYLEEIRAILFAPITIGSIRESNRLFAVAFGNMSHLATQNSELTRWIYEPTGEKEKVIFDRLCNELNARTTIAQSECRDRVLKLRQLLESCRADETKLEEKIYRTLWEIPHPIPEKLATAVGDRVLLIVAWLQEFGDLERCKKLGERISNWLQITADGVGYDSPLFAKHQPRINDALHHHDIEQIHRVGCISEAILVASDGIEKDELDRRLTAMPKRFHFFGLQDWEKEYRLADDNATTEPVAREAFAVRYKQYELDCRKAAQLSGEERDAAFEDLRRRFELLRADRDWPHNNLELDNNLDIRARVFPEEIAADSPNDGQSGFSDGKRDLSKLDQSIQDRGAKPIDKKPTVAFNDGLDRETRSFRWLGELYQNLSDDQLDAIEKIEKNHQKGRPTTKESLLKDSGQTSIGKLFRRGDANRLKAILIDTSGSVDLPKNRNE